MRAVWQRAILLIGLALVLPAVVQAAETKPAAAAPPAAALPANPRDFSGIWMNDNTIDELLKREGRQRLNASEDAGPVEPAERPLTSQYQAIYKKMQSEKAQRAQGTEGCKWPGLPNIMTYPYPFEVLQTPGRITLLFEADSQVRRIFMGRRKHLDFDDLDPSYNGDSIGQWEGDTLVVDTIGFNDETTVRGLPHSEDMHIVERIRYVAANTIEDQITITDPKAFTRPVVSKVIYSRRPEWRIREYSCTENNRDAPDASGQRSGGVVR